MALFKIFKGNSANLPEEKHDGYCYFTTDDGIFYIDYLDADGTTLRRRPISGPGNSIEYIVGTQTKATGAWTGVTKDPSLTVGKTIAYKLPYAGSGNASLTLTFTNPIGTATTGAIAIYTNTTRVTTQYGKDSVILLTYDGTYWRASEYWNTNSRDPGYGKITPGAASTATEAIIANTIQIAAGTYNENLNINPGNKWVQVSATSGASNGGDTLTLGHALSDVTAGISSPNAAQTPGFNSTFNIPTVTVDEAGHVTAMGTTTVKIPANPNTDITVKQTAKTDNVDYKILTTTSASPTSGSAAEAGYGANLAYNPSTNTLKTGNASLTGTLNVTGQTTFNQIPVSITPEATSNDTSVATTAFVKNAISGLSGAMHFRGTTTTAITDGSTTNPITISGSSYTATAGDVVLREVTTGNIFEYIWTGSAWEMLGRDTSFKVTQSAVSSPAANGNTTAFIDTISQDTNGNITVTKKNLDTSGTWSGTAAKATADASGNNIIDTYATKQYVDNAEVSSAATLITPRTIQTDLTSNTAVSFDGSSNITPGVTGILRITNGGTGNADGYIRTGQYSGSTIGDNATIEGINNIASGVASHAEGTNVTASGEMSHAEGLLTIASGNTTHAEGVETTASGDVSHAEGVDTTASGRTSHSEGGGTVASGEASHAEGNMTVASGYASHAEGFSTIAKGISSHVFGEYNEEDVNNITRHSIEGYGNYVEIVGNGTADDARSNARTLDWNGNEILAGKLTVGINPINNMDVATKQYVDSHINNTIIYVTDFGATGDGVTNDSTSIQNAIDSARNGGTIVFPIGTYKLETSLKFYSNQTLFFEEGATLLQGAEINNLLRNYATLTDTLYSATKNVKIIGGIFDGGNYSTNNTLLGFTHANNILIERCSFKNGYGTWHDIEVNSSKDVIIRNCYFDGSRRSGDSGGETIQLDSLSLRARYPWEDEGAVDSTPCENIIIEQCVFNNIKRMGIGQHSTTIIYNLCIQNNKIHGDNGITGIYLPYVNNFIASKNGIDNFTTTGISLYNSEKINITENTIMNCTTAVYSSSTKDGIINNNIFIGTNKETNQGVKLSAISNFIITNNIFKTYASACNLTNDTNYSLSIFTNNTLIDISTAYNYVYGTPFIIYENIINGAYYSYGTSLTEIDSTIKNYVDNASNLSSGTVAFDRLPSMYWANTAVASAVSYNTTPEVASVKIGNGTATTAGAKGATLQYDATLETLNFVFA